MFSLCPAVTRRADCGIGAETRMNLSSTNPDLLSVPAPRFFGSHVYTMQNSSPYRLCGHTAICRYNIALVFFFTPHLLFSLCLEFVVGGPNAIQVETGTGEKAKGGETSQRTQR